MKSSREVVTRVRRVSTRTPGDAAIREAAGLIRAGRLVAFPTETVYGLGADGLNAIAVARIFAAKGRPHDNPLILHVAETAGLELLAKQVPETARVLAERFWPGPLTLVVPRSERVPDETTAGLQTVAVRCPDHPVALALIRAAGVPIAAPSANVSGRPSPTSAQHVLDDLRGRVDMVLDAGPTGIGLESTVVDVSGRRVLLLRPGGLPVEELEQVLGEAVTRPSRQTPAAAAPSPGMKYTHYSPRARLVLVDRGSAAANVETMRVQAERSVRAGDRVGLLCTLEAAELLPGLGVVAVLGSREDAASLAANLFAGLRELDKQGCDCIIAEGVERTGYGLGVMDRLTRAADELVSEGE